MNKLVISVQNVSKLYRIGEKEQEYRTLRETLIHSITSPIKNFREIVKLTNFNDNKGNLSTNNIIYALRDISFEVHEGEVLGLIGRNGAGKSTMLKILSRIIRPSKGRVVIKGRLSSLLEIGTGFHPDLTGRENIYMNGSILGMKRREINDKFDKIVSFAGVEKFLDTPVKRYSSGMYVRLAFAVAAHLEQEILLVDEILAVGDLEFQKKCYDKMKNVASAGRTVIMVSHDLGAISSLCPRCILLEEGRIYQDGGTQKCLEVYHNEINKLIQFE